jgi:glucan-binding YG repeat protein
MNSIKQVIVNAVYKVSEDPQYANKDYPTPQDARADFIKSLIAELFPDNPSVPESTYVAPVAVAEKKKRAPKAKKEEEAEVKVEVPVVAEAKAEEPKEKKKRAPKAKKVAELTTDMKHEEVVAEVKAEVKVEEVKAEVKAEEVKPEEPKEKKKRAPKAKKEETEEVKEEKKPKTTKKEEKPKHVEKLSPTDTKKLKAIADEAKQEFDKKAVLAYLNGLEKETLDSKTLEEHAREFYVPKETIVEKELLCVDFKGEEYYVDTDTTPMKVYKSEGEVDKLVGHVGALEFADMVVPSYE